jgi:hypothetical protein
MSLISTSSALSLLSHPQNFPSFSLSPATFPCLIPHFRTRSSPLLLINSDHIPLPLPHKGFEVILSAFSYAPLLSYGLINSPQNCLACEASQEKMYGSLPCIQEPCTCPYSEPVHTTTSYLRSIFISTHYVLVFLVVSFPLAFLQITYMRSSSAHSCYVHRPSQLLVVIIIILPNPLSL